MFDKPSSLNELGYFICGVARKQEPVSRLHLVGKSHECQGVTAEGCQNVNAKESNDLQFRRLRVGGAPDQQLNCLNQNKSPFC